MVTYGIVSIVVFFIAEALYVYAVLIDEKRHRRELEAYIKKQVEERLEEEANDNIVRANAKTMVIA